MKKGDTVQLPKQRKRNRVPISCTICRRRKVKCDKKKPQCTNCIKNGVQHLCRYLEPSWAKPLDDDELKFPGATVSSNGNTSLVSSDREDSIAGDDYEEITRLRLRVKELEHETVELKKRANNHSTTRSLMRASDTADLFDCISNSNILFTAKKGPMYNFPIIYQISVFSWMFIVRNDSYMNDLWLKILKLRKHYEYYYSSKNAMLDASKNLETDYTNYDKMQIQSGPTKVLPEDISTVHTSKLKKFLEGSISLNGKVSTISPNSPTTPQTPRNSITVKQEESKCPVMHNSTPSQLEKCPVTGEMGTCPVGHGSNVDDNSIQQSKNSKPQTLQQQAQQQSRLQNDQRLVMRRCPVLHPDEPSLGYATPPSRTKKHKLKNEFDPSGDLGSQLEDDEEEDEIEDPKICPLMIGDARALFKEKLSRMSVSAIRDLPKIGSPRVTSISADFTENETGGRSGSISSVHTPIAQQQPQPQQQTQPDESQDTSELTPVSGAENDVKIGMKRGMSCPVTGCSTDTKAETTPASKKTRRSNNKKIKTISPSAIKNLNYNNTKQVISVIEKHLPNRKVVWMLIDRFFEKLYIHLPYVEEENFRVRIASIIDTADSTSQKIKLGSIGSQYCEEFLNICLLMIILRLSWLSLPSKTLPTMTAEEHILMRPENVITMVLVDMVKEIFSSAKIMSKPSIIIFQVGLFLKFYNIMSPEDGFDLDDSYTNTNTTLLNSNDLSGDLTNENPNMNTPNFMYMLIQLAKTIGLNRDPLNFKNFYTNSDDPLSNARMFRKRHLWRKLWYGLLFLSIESNLSLGDYKKGLPIELDVDPTLGQVNRTWDCRLPGGVEQGVLEKSFRGGIDGGFLKKEQVVVSNFRDSIIVYHLLHKAMSALFSVANPPTSKELDLIISKLLELISERSKIGLNTSFFLKPVSSDDDSSPINTKDNKNGKFDTYVKIYRFRMFLVIKSMLFSLNYLLFLNHEQKFNRLISEKTSTLAKLDKQKEYINTYFEGSLLLAIDNYNIFIQVFDNSGILFPNAGSELILYPFLMILNHRSHEFLISLILRLQQNSPIVMDILNKNNIDKEELLNRLFHYLKTFLDKLEDLTKSYYYAWRLKKLVKFFYNILTNSNKLFNINFKAMNIGIKDENQNEGLLESTPPPNGRPNLTDPNTNNTALSPTNGGTNNGNGDSGLMAAPLNNSTNVCPVGYGKAVPGQTPTDSSTKLSSNVQVELPSPMQSHPLNLHQQQLPQVVHNNGVQLQHSPTTIKREPTNAFEIAFGTSKLPPVTDYTSTLNNNDLLYSQQQQEQQVDISLYHELNKPTGAPSLPLSMSSGAANGQLTDLFDDNFFSELTDFNGSGPSDMIPGFSSDMQHHHLYLQNLQQQQQLILLQQQAQQEGNGLQHQIDRLSPTSNIIGNDSQLLPNQNQNQSSNMVRNNNNGFMGSSGYNPLNEIDFTNVDLSSPFDTNAPSSSYANNFGNGSSGLGGLNFGFQ